MRSTISEPLAEHLGREGFDAEVAGTIEAATKALARNASRPDPPGRHAARRGRSRPLSADPDANPTCPSSCSRRAVRRSIASSVSSSAPTTTWSSRSPPVSSSRACARSCVGVAPPRGKVRSRSARSPRPLLAHRHEGRRADRARREGVRSAARADGERRRRHAARGDHGRGLGPALVRTDEDAGRPHLVAPQEDRRRPRRRRGSSRPSAAWASDSRRRKTWRPTPPSDHARGRHHEGSQPTRPRVLVRGRRGVGRADRPARA